MRQVTLPYGKSSLTFQLPERNLLAIVEPADVPAVADPGAAVQAAVRQPVGSPPLREKIKRGMKVVIVVDDFTRPTPAHQLLPALLAELDPAGNALDVSIIVAAGTHRPMSKEEINAKIGAAVAGRYPVIMHDAYDDSAMVDLGRTKNGTPIKINRLVSGADLVIGVSNVVPHCLAGWSGGAKIIQPGVCSAETTNATHATATMSAFPHIGRLDNPTRIEIEEVVTHANLNLFSINVVLNRHMQVVNVVAGHPTPSHRKTVELAERVWVVPVPAMPDIVVCSSHPSDADFWQAGKGLFASENIVKRGGDVILATPCPERIAIAEHTETLRALKGLPSRVGRHETERRRIRDLAGVNVAVALARMHELAWVSIYSEGLTDEDLDILGCARAVSVQSALDLAFKRQGPDAQVVAITHGGELCPVVRSTFQ